MKEIILRAKTILSQMFGIDPIHFERHSTREVPVVGARRFLIKFLRDDFQVPYQEICKHIPALTNHATAIHHHKLLNDEYELYKNVREKYDTFRSELINHPNNLVEREIMELTEERKQINNKLYKLKKLL
tara:strand:+ start:221 stop:610 length:390 start_codon:yes stop_codon:yes gene_type:complete